MKIDLGKILTRSWQIIWNHKVLWIFGILAGFANSGGGGNGGGNNGTQFERNGTNPFPNGQVERYTEQFNEFFQQYMLIIIAICLFIFILSLVFFALGMMGRIGLLKGVYKLEQGASSLMFAELWSESMPYFWRFVGLNLLVGLVVFVIVLVLVVPFVFLGVATAGIALVCLVPFLCLLVPISWAIGVVMEQAQAAIVAEDLNVFDALKRGWEIAKSDIGGMIVLSLVLGIGSALIGVVLALPMIAAMMPLIFSAASMDSFSSIPPTAWITVACCVIYFPILLVLNGVIVAYTKTAWALSYLQLTNPKSEVPVFAEGNA